MILKKSIFPSPPVKWVLTIQNWVRQLNCGNIPLRSADKVGNSRYNFTAKTLILPPEEG